MPIDLTIAAQRVRAASTLPTREQGAILPYVRPSPFAPGWNVFAAQSQMDLPDDLKYPKSRRTYGAMERVPQIAGLLASIYLPIRHMQAYVDPRGTTGTVAEEMAEDFGLPLEGDEQHDEDGPGVDYDEHLRLALLVLANGHKAFEFDGVIEGNGPGAKFRMRNLFERPNEIIQDISITPGGDLISIRVPSARPEDGPFVDLPAEHLLYYCWDRRGGDWTGRPLLYGCYQSWLLRDELVREDAVMVRRFGGIPWVETTEREASNPKVDAEAAAMAAALQSGDGAGVNMPFGKKLHLAGVEGTLPKPLESVRYHDQQMARVFMQSVMELGQTPNGSRALGEVQMDHFTLGLLAIRKAIIKTQMQLVRRIVEWNYGPGTPLPHIRFREDDVQDLATDALVSLIEAGAVVVDDDLEEQIRKRGNLVPRNPAQAGRIPPADVSAVATPKNAAAARSLTAATAATGSSNTGVMVALYPPPGVAAGLALEGGEPAEELHITLAFLGQRDDLADPTALHAAVRVWAAQTPAIVGEVSGVGLFTAGEEPVTYLSADLPALPQARQDLIAALVAAGVTPSEQHGFTPHMTLDYADRVAEVDEGGRMLTFANVTVVVGDDRTDYRLGEGTAVASRAERPGLRRKPTAAAASDQPGEDNGVDHAALDAAFAAALALLKATWNGVRAAQIEDVLAQIRTAASMEEVAAVTPAPLGAQAFADVLAPLIEQGAASVVEEALAQGVDLATPDLAEATKIVGLAAVATALLLAKSLGTSAASKALSMWGANPDRDAVATAVGDYLGGMAGTAADYELAGLATQAQNEGRFQALEGSPNGTAFFAHEPGVVGVNGEGAKLGDGIICEPCIRVDGTEYASMSDARIDYPSGYYRDCEGGKRCRGTVLARFGAPGGNAALAVPRAARRYGLPTAAFDPNQRRDKDGKWTDSVGNVMKVATPADRDRLSLPPAWTDVMVAADGHEEQALQAIGTDSKGRIQRVYSSEHEQRQAAIKFERIRHLHGVIGSVDAELAGDDSEAGAALKVIRRTGMRPGSDSDTGADVDAYGATNLRAKHVMVDGDAVRLQFTGKKGVALDFTFNDPELAALFAPRIDGKDGEERVFDTDATKVRARLAEIAPGYKVKDLRTYRGTRLARDLVAAEPIPTTATERKAGRNRVGDEVAAVLGNTRAVALKSYIDPAAFSAWDVAA